MFSHISYLVPSNGCNELSKGFGYTKYLTRATIVKRNALDGYEYYCIALVMSIVLLLAVKSRLLAEYLALY